MTTFKQRGTAAIELAVILVATLVLMPAAALFAMVFFQYSVMKDATRDAAMYMATLPRAALIDPIERQRASAVAQRMVREAALQAGMTGLTRVYEATVQCDGATCAEYFPDAIDVNVVFTINDTLFSHWTGDWTDEETRTWRVIIRSTIPVSRK